MHAIRPCPDYLDRRSFPAFLNPVGADMEPFRDGQREEGRRLAEAELTRWKFRMPCSIARVLTEMHGFDEQRSPMLMVSNWLRLNCRSAWKLVPVPGGDVFFCLNDAECARLVMVKFGRSGGSLSGTAG